MVRKDHKPDPDPEPVVAVDEETPGLVVVVVLLLLLLLLDSAGIILPVSTSIALSNSSSLPASSTYFKKFELRPIVFDIILM